MPESTTSDQNPDALVQQDSNNEHTGACGEKHQHLPSTPGHRDSCTSPMKFGNSCCCGSGQGPKEDNPRCGHGPKCQ